MVKAGKRKTYLLVGGPPVLIDGQPVGVGQSFSAEALGDDRLLGLLLQSGQVVEGDTPVMVEPPVDAPVERPDDIKVVTSDDSETSEGTD